MPHTNLPTTVIPAQAGTQSNLNELAVAVGPFSAAGFRVAQTEQVVTCLGSRLRGNDGGVWINADGDRAAYATVLGEVL